MSEQDIIHTTRLIRDLQSRMNHTEGKVREAYCEVIESEIYRLIRQVDLFKLECLEQMVQVDVQKCLRMASMPHFTKDRVIA